MAGPWSAYWLTHTFPWNGNITYSATQLLAHTDYAINAGPTAINFPTDASPDGVSYTQSKVAVAGITDGTSNTYLVGEKTINPDSYLTSGSMGDDSCVYGGHDYDIARWTANNPNFYPREDTPGVDMYRAFGSAHTSVFHMSLCDGSVRGFNYSISPAIHALLGNRRDGQTIDGSKF